VFQEIIMADYFSPTVIQQSIPIRDMTALERLLLTHIFDAEPDGEGLYFYADRCPADMIVVSRAELDAALAASPEPTQNTVATCVAEHLANLPPERTDVDLDLTGICWEAIIQDIVRRSSSLRYVTVLSSFICSRMRADGFGGMAVLITADRIVGKSTTDLIYDFLAEAGLDP
jgi:hypothetical protein